MAEQTPALPKNFDRIYDAAFSAARCADYCLSVQVSFNGIKLAVFDNLNSRYLAVENHAFPNCNDFGALLPRLQKFADNHEWLNNRFKRTDVMVVNERSTLVPNALFDAEQQAQYLQFNHPRQESEEIRNDQLRNLDARNLWLIPHDLELLLKKIFPGARLCHYSTPLIESLLVASKNEQQKKVYAHLQYERFELIIPEGNRLHLYNTYAFKSSDDFIFFLLFACEQLKLNPETFELVLLGELTDDSAVAGIARKYIRHVKFGERPVQAAFGPAFDVLPAWQHYNLFCLHYFS